MRKVAQTLLMNKTYDIEFHGYLSNHAKHAVVALERLQAPETRIQEYWDNYTSLTPYNLPLHKISNEWDNVEPATHEQWNHWRGKKIHWQKQVTLLNKELQEKYNNNTNSLVKEYAPPLLSGAAGALTHGIIHLGWAIDAESPWMIFASFESKIFCFSILWIFFFLMTNHSFKEFVHSKSEQGNEKMNTLTTLPSHEHQRTRCLLLLSALALIRDSSTFATVIHYFYPQGD